LRRKLWHGRAVDFLDTVEGPDRHVQVAQVPEELEDEALRWLRQHDEREYSFVDATSFAYMHARGIEGGARLRRRLRCGRLHRTAAVDSVLSRRC
jgi:predicted nucleic acid-binding protein